MADANPSRPVKAIKPPKTELKLSTPIAKSETPKGPKPVKITDLKSGNRLVRF
jgi:hypothetical protein